jgi:hypothetical protein
MSTLDDHLQFFIGQERLGYRKSITDQYTVKIGNDCPSNQNINGITENDVVADYIGREYGKVISVIIYPTIETYVIVETLLRHGFVITGIIPDYGSELNTIQVEQSKKLCTELGIKSVIKETRLLDLINSGEAFDIAKQVQCTNLVSVVEVLISQTVDHVIIGNNDVSVGYSESDKSLILQFSETGPASVYRYSLSSRRPIINTWFWTTPNMVRLACWALLDSHQKSLPNVKIRAFEKLFSVCVRFGFSDQIIGIKYAFSKQAQQLFVKRYVHSTDGISIGRSLCI